MFMTLKLLIYRWSDYWKLMLYRGKWRNKNPHNLTNAGTIFPMERVSIGKGTYGTLNVISYNNKDERLIIGNYCSIAGQVTILLSGEHRHDCLSTYPFKKIVIDNMVESKTKGPIIIEDDVWIGFGTTILSGVRIGQGAVIGARSIVYKDVPPYAVYAGNRIVKFRFDKNIIEKMVKIDYSLIDKETIMKNRNIFSEPLTESNVDAIIEQLMGNKYDSK